MMMSTYSWLVAISVPLSSWMKKHTMNNATDAVAHLPIKWVSTSSTPCRN